MNWNKSFQYDWSKDRGIIGVDILPYQLAIGLSLRYLKCLDSIMFRIYLGPFKLWGNIPVNLHKEDIWKNLN